MIDDINIANSCHFISIGGGKYYYFSRGVFSKKAYILNSKEKKDIEYFFQSLMLKVLSAGVFFTTVSLINIYYSVIGISISGVYFCFKISNKIKNILSGKKRTLVPDRSAFDFFIQRSTHFTYKEIIKRLIVAPLLFIFPWYFGDKAMMSKPGFNVFLVFIVIFIGLSMLYDFLHLFFKLRTSFLGKFKN